MSWPYLPADFDALYESAWVWAPNSLYDPVKGSPTPRSWASTAFASTNTTRTPTA
jgi:hypothetical protein